MRVPARHKELSVICSLDDEVSQPTQRLLSLATAAAGRASDLRFADLDQRTSSEQRWYKTWPGEHYRLLAALVAEIAPTTVIEIGTATGMGTLALASTLPPGSRIYTFDIVPWTQFDNTWLTKADFADGRITQVIANIADPEGLSPYREIFSAVDFLFIDGPKDGVTEDRFIQNISQVPLHRNPIVMFDDIRVMNMIRTWRQLQRPKLDLTSFGHWSGTGLVDWNALRG